jgi:acyl dehydratase
MPDDPARIGHRTVTPEAVATFGSLTGDYSRIHFDHELGEASPHGRGFAHGLLGASWALGAMTLYAPRRVGCGEAGAYVSSFEVRFDDVVRFGDTLAFECRDAKPEPVLDGWDRRGSEFAARDAEGRTPARGAVGLSTHPDGPAGGLPRVEARPWTVPTARDEPQPRAGPMAAEDVFDHGPRGVSRVRTLTEADVVNFANFTGELNPLYLDAVFARHALFGERIAPPMLCFCLGFSVWLRELLRLPLGGSASSAGHLGDRWRFLAPVRIGDTLEVRYQPLSLRRTRSQPTRGVLTFGLQLVNQHGAVVEQGEVDMMLDMRDSE